METALITWWSVAHALAGIAFGFLFNLKFSKISLWIIPIDVIVMLITRNIGVAVVGFTIIGLITLGLALKYLKERKIILNNFLIIIIVLIIMIGWELFEYYALGRIPFVLESPRNSIADIVVGFTGFIVTFLLLKKKGNKKKR